MAVPTIWVKMIAHFDQQFKADTTLSRRARQAAASLRLAISGSAALPGPIRQAWADIANGYLLLERYVADDGRDVSNVSGAVGEIQVKTPGLLKEYWRKPGATSKDITSDGWWKTGDMAVTKAEHNNAAFIQGRASVDIIKSGGYKISALDIETAMLQLPFIREVAVMGVADPTWGEMVAAVCVPVEGKAEELTAANVRESLRSELAPYKLPQKVHVLQVMPRNAMGKVQKKALREKCFPNPPAAKL
ncbi:hypothetical protein PRZ48_002571 [Zasmidium cellare]|uniref:AMP-binding enzyme C-terminal domain-containing protein n=1 Tax=Zasmidium cellare TaxID=395010 RepID=A0ABR0ETM4_ZASCE|nr:hypothetical protein PRZ48_002571 [Zasmidium cellare]